MTSSDMTVKLVGVLSEKDKQSITEFVDQMRSENIFETAKADVDSSLTSGTELLAILAINFAVGTVLVKFIEAILSEAGKSAWARIEPLFLKNKNSRVEVTLEDNGTTYVVALERVDRSNPIENIQTAFQFMKDTIATTQLSLPTNVKVVRIDFDAGKMKATAHRSRTSPPIYEYQPSDQTKWELSKND